MRGTIKFRVKQYIERIFEIKASSIMEAMEIVDEAGEWDAELHDAESVSFVNVSGLLDNGDEVFLAKGGYREFYYTNGCGID